jgi:hypothetical protein
VATMIVKLIALILISAQGLHVSHEASHLLLCPYAGSGGAWLYVALGPMLVSHTDLRRTSLSRQVLCTRRLRAPS